MVGRMSIDVGISSMYELRPSKRVSVVYLDRSLLRLCRHKNCSVNIRVVLISGCGKKYGEGYMDKKNRT